MRAALESDLGVSAQRVVKKATAEGWNVVGVVSSSAVDGNGRVETMLSLRGRRPGGGRFVVTFVDGAFDGAWFWTRHHRAVDKGYRREDVWVKTKYDGRLWYPGTRVEVLEPRLKRDPSLDVEVTWTTGEPVRVRLGSLAALVGVVGGKNPRPGLLESVDSEVTQ